MACYSPIKVYKSRNQKGISFKQTTEHADEGEIPCYYCLGCRLERSRQWAVRCVHEAKMHEKNCFITLTYDEKNLPKNKMLNKREFQLFMKKLRKKYGKGIRYFHCGEYGEKYKRPHYHACIFGHDFEDKELWKGGKNKLWRSKSLEKLWPKGFSTIGALTFETAAYVSRYCTKKLYGDSKELYPEYMNPVTGELIKYQPEYATMSRRPGIGALWYEKYKNDVYPSDEIISRGKKMKPPKYYDILLEKENKKKLEIQKEKREYENSKRTIDNTPKRRLIKQKHKELTIKMMKREYENEK